MRVNLDLATGHRGATTPVAYDIVLEDGTHRGSGVIELGLRYTLDVALEEPNFLRVYSPVDGRVFTMALTPGKSHYSLPALVSDVASLDQVTDHGTELLPKDFRITEWAFTGGRWSEVGWTAQVKERTESRLVFEFCQSSKFIERRCIQYVWGEEEFRCLRLPDSQRVSVIFTASFCEQDVEVRADVRDHQRMSRVVTEYARHGLPVQASEVCRHFLPSIDWHSNPSACVLVAFFLPPIIEERSSDIGRLVSDRGPKRIPRRWSSEILVAIAWRLLRTELTNSVLSRARKCLLTAVARDMPPVYTLSMKRLVEALTMFNGIDGNDRAVSGALELLKPFSEFTDWSEPILSFRGGSPDTPRATKVSDGHGKLEFIPYKKEPPAQPTKSSTQSSPGWGYVHRRDRQRRRRRRNTLVSTKAVRSVPLEHYSIIRRPLVTEKSVTQTSRENTYSFEVHSSSTKLQIRDAIECLFDVRVKKVRTLSRKGKPVRSGTGKTQSWKKAVVQLHEDDAITLF